MANRRLKAKGQWLNCLLLLAAAISALIVVFVCVKDSNQNTGLQKSRHHDQLFPSDLKPLRFDKRSPAMYYPGPGDDPSDSDSDSSSSDSSSSGGDRSTGISVGASTANQQDDGIEGKDLERRRQIWEKCLSRGQQIVKLMDQTTIPESEQSKFHSYRDLKKWGWEVKEGDGESVKWEKNWNGALVMLNVPYGVEHAASKVRWKAVEIKHARASVNYDDMDRIYEPTKGTFKMLFDPKDGISIAYDSVGPAYTGRAKRKKMQPQDITPLKHLSDIRYLAWEHECKLANVPPSALRFHLASDIRNAETRDAMREVLGGFLMAKLPLWPGIVLTERKDATQFAGIMGTPIGLAVGRFLAQRKGTTGSERCVASIRLWQGKTSDTARVIEYGPPLYALFELSDSASGAGSSKAAGGGAGQSAQKAGGGAAAPGGKWGKGEPVVGGEQQGNAAASFSLGSGQRDAKGSLNDALQQAKPASGATAGGRGDASSPSQPQGSSPHASRRSRIRRMVSNELLEEANMAIHKYSRHVSIERRSQQGDLPIRSTAFINRERSVSNHSKRAPEQDFQSPTNQSSDTVQSSTKRSTVGPPKPPPSASLAPPSKLVQRADPGDQTDLNEAFRDRVDPRRTGRLAFAGDDESSKVSQFSEYNAVGGGLTSGSRDFSVVLHKAQEDGERWSELLGSDSISPDDESQVPENFQEGPSDYGYNHVRAWKLPVFRGLIHYVPGFDDAHGRPDPAWRVAKWVHKDSWVDDDEFKHHPVSNGMFENAYAPHHGAIVYITHTEPLKPAHKGKQPQSKPANRVPEGTGSGVSGSTQDWSDYSTKPVPPEESDPENRPPRKVTLQKQEGKHIKEEDLTPLRLQDVWMFDWYGACQLEGQPVGALKHVILLDITETHTLQVLTELPHGDIRQWGIWPGTEWMKLDNEPLIGTPLGLAVAKLIVQRPGLFGSERDLRGGRVWWTPPAQGAGQDDKGTVSMIFTLSDPPRELIEKQMQEVRSRGPQRLPPGEQAGQRKGIWG